MSEQLFGTAEATGWIAVPAEHDDKYSRGVVGFITGSARYPGAAVLGVEAALRTGVGMVRFVDPEPGSGASAPSQLVLQRRPEAVIVPGRVQAWVVGSGYDDSAVDSPAGALIEETFTGGLPIVVDGGAIGLVQTLRRTAVLTPHAGELATLVGIERSEVLADPDHWARDAARRTGAVVLLKGHTTRIADPDGRLLRVRSAPSWLATAGAGDALAGILGALLATHAARIEADPGAVVSLAATAAVIHGLAAERASRGGPLVILDLCTEIAPVVAELAASSPRPSP